MTDDVILDEPDEPERKLTPCDPVWIEDWDRERWKGELTGLGIEVMKRGMQVADMLLQMSHGESRFVPERHRSRKRTELEDWTSVVSVYTARIARMRAAAAGELVDAQEIFQGEEMVTVGRRLKWGPRTHLAARYLYDASVNMLRNFDRAISRMSKIGELYTG